MDSAVYYWEIEGGSIISGQGTNEIDVVWGSQPAGTIKVVVTSDNCKNSVIKSIKINPSPNAKTGRDTTICTGGSTMIGSEAVAGNIYSWSSNPAGFTSNQAQHKVSPLVNTTFYLTEIITETGCSKTDSVKITVSPNHVPNPFIIGDSTHCKNSVSMFSSKSNAGSTLLWKVLNGKVVTGQGTDTIMIVWENPGRGSVKAIETTLFGCTDSNEIAVTINPLPSADFSYTGTCTGSPTLFKATNTTGNSYSWSFGNGNSSSSFTPQHQFPDTGKYEVKLKVQNKAGCIDSVIKTISIFPTPEAMAGESKTICYGESSYIGEGAKHNLGYSWISVPPGFTSTLANPIVTPGISTTYFLTVIDSTGKCTGLDSVTINVIPKIADAITGEKMFAFLHWQIIHIQKVHHPTATNGKSPEARLLQDRIQKALAFYGMKMSRMAKLKQ